VNHILDLLDRLRRLPVLRHLPLAALDRLASQSELAEFLAHERLLEEGAPGDAVYALLEGRVAVRGALSEQEEGVLAVRSAGELVGEMALVDDLPRSATVTAEGPVRALRIPRAAFREAVGAHPEAALDLVRTLSARLREATAAQLDSLRAKAERLEKSNRKLSRENTRLRTAVDERYGFESFVGSSRAARQVREAARRAAESDLPVLLVGETGTGKELVARTIHANGDRRHKPFVPVNCALFSESLLESELFGHARGAFTGAHASKPGLVEAADGGTLFLDELADMPRPLQAALLRFLELGEFRRLGETRVRRVDVRVIAAVQVEIESAVASGALRRDLAYRLDVFRIALPPLRARKEDTAPLASHFVEEIARRLRTDPLRLQPEALDALAHHDFPGNVRELRNEIERLYAHRESDRSVARDALSETIRTRAPEAERTYAEAVRAFKSRLVREALERSGGTRAAAARALGVHPSNLLRMMRELGIDAPASAHLGRRDG